MPQTNDGWSLGSSTSDSSSRRNRVSMSQVTIAVRVAGTHPARLSRRVGGFTSVWVRLSILAMRSALDTCIWSRTLPPKRGRDRLA